MNNHEIFYEADPGTALTHAPATGVATLPAFAVSQPDSRFGRKLEAKGQRAVAIAHMESRVANEAVLCVGAVCATAQVVIDAIPFAQGPVPKIVHGLADNVVKQINNGHSWY
jgi:hypothetical protein